MSEKTTDSEAETNPKVATEQHTRKSSMPPRSDSKTAAGSGRRCKSLSVQFRRARLAKIRTCVGSHSVARPHDGRTGNADT